MSCRLWTSTLWCRDEACTPSLLKLDLVEISICSRAWLSPVPHKSKALHGPPPGSCVCCAEQSQTAEAIPLEHDCCPYNEGGLSKYIGV